MNGACNVKLFFGPAPWGPGEGSKGQISFNFNYIVQSQFQRFLYQTLCVFSQMKDTKHIRRDFYSVPWVMPQGWDFEALGGALGSNFFFSNMVMWYIKSTGMTSRTECKLNFHPRVKLVTLSRGQRSNIIKFRLPCQFQRFLYQILCVFSQMKDTKHIRRGFYSVAWVMPQGWDFGALGVHRGSNNFLFQTWSCSISNRRG